MLTVCCYVSGGFIFTSFQVSTIPFHIMSVSGVVRGFFGSLQRRWAGDGKSIPCQILQAYYSWSILACEPFLCCWQLRASYQDCVMPESGNKDGGKNTWGVILANIQLQYMCVCSGLTPTLSGPAGPKWSFTQTAQHLCRSGWIEVDLATRRPNGQM